jgi:murein DD-endopeptidase MepM/ murein hydrolase activator NlpD
MKNLIQRMKSLKSKLARLHLGAASAISMLALVSIFGFHPVTGPTLVARSFASEADDQSSACDPTKYCASFTATGTSPIMIRSESGEDLGLAPNDLTFSYPLDPSVVERATDPKNPDLGVNMNTILNAIAISPWKGRYVQVTLPEEVVTADGRTIPAGRVYLDLSAFEKFAVQPTGVVGDAPGDFNRAVAHGSYMTKKGKRYRPRPQQVAAEEIVPLDREQPEENEGGPLPGGKTLGSPTCSCIGTKCVVSSHFSNPRTRRCKKKNGAVVKCIKPHGAIDVASGLGTPVAAAASGYISLVQNYAANTKGKALMIDHSHGLKTQYEHLSVIDPEILNGKKKWVNKGDVIARMGRTGSVRGRTGVNLHFEVLVNGAHVNPEKYLPGQIPRDLNPTCRQQPTFGMAGQFLHSVAVSTAISEDAADGSDGDDGSVPPADAPAPKHHHHHVSHHGNSGSAPR